jgi:hypothetical protein
MRLLAKRPDFRAGERHAHDRRVSGGLFTAAGCNPVGLRLPV